MPQDNTITTERLYLVPFAPEHAEALFTLNSDPDIMRYLGGPQSRAETDENIKRVQDRWNRLGYGWWTVFLKGTDTVVGSACLQNLAHDESEPLEIGWRLKAAHHGKGYATEAGQAAMDFGFERLGVDYIYAVTEQENIASQKVMQRLGMTYLGLQTHYDMQCVVYEIRKA